MSSVVIMVFWFCKNCKKVWHSYVQTPGKVRTIRCFYCMKNASVRLKEDKLEEGKFKYGDYDVNTREFLKVRKNKNNNHKMKNVKKAV